MDSTAENLLRPIFTANATLWRSTMRALLSSTKLYVIFITPRSGSTWLTEMATLDGRLGMPDEWFNFSVAGKPDVNDYVLETVMDYRSAAGMMGVELDYYQASMLSELLERPMYDTLERISFFYLRRENIVAQAISLYRSVESGHWNSLNQNPEALERFRSLPYDATRIREWTQHINESEQKLEKLFEKCRIAPRRFSYEHMRSNPKAIMDWMYGVVAGTNAGAEGQSLRAGDIRPISDNVNASWEKRFREEMADFVGDVEVGRADFYYSPDLLIRLSMPNN